MLCGWVRQSKAEANQAFRRNGKVTAQDEQIRRLRREVSDLREERDILRLFGINGWDLYRWTILTKYDHVEALS